MQLLHKNLSGFSLNPKKKINNQKKTTSSEISLLEFEERFRDLYLDEEIGCKSIITNDPLDKYLEKQKDILKFNIDQEYLETTLYYFDMLITHAYYLEHQFLNHIEVKYHNLNSIRHLTEILKSINPEKLLDVCQKNNILRYQRLKEYSSDLMKFITKYPALLSPLMLIPVDLLYQPYFIFYKKDRNLMFYQPSWQNQQLLQIISECYRKRTLDISEKNNKDLLKMISKIRKNEPNRVIVTALKLREKIYKYQGIKHPENLKFLSFYSTTHS